MLDEAERSLHDALCVVADMVKQRKVTYGGGAAEMEMAGAVEKLAREVRTHDDTIRFFFFITCGNPIFFLFLFFLLSSAFQIAMDTRQHIVAFQFYCCAVVCFR